MTRAAPRSSECTRSLAGEATDPSARPGRADRLALALELQQLHQTSGLRITEDHALVLLTMRHSQPNAFDVSTLYRKLLDEGHAMPLGRLYRILRVLEEIETVQRSSETHQGRQRSVFSLSGRVIQGDEASPVCAHCGAPLGRHAGVEEGSA